MDVVLWLYKYQVDDIRLYVSLYFATIIIEAFVKTCTPNFVVSNWRTKDNGAPIVLKSWGPSLIRWVVVTLTMQEPSP